MQNIKILYIIFEIISASPLSFQTPFPLQPVLDTSLYILISRLQKSRHSVVEFAFNAELSTEPEKNIQLTVEVSISKHWCGVGAD